MKKKERARVISQKMLSQSIFDLEIGVSFAKDARPGQFVSLFTEDPSRLMPRPISICGMTDGTLRLVYRVVGSGTADFSALKAGDEITCLGPLGNGFDLKAAAGRHVLLVGGGIGLPPMLGLGQALKERKGAEAPASVTFVSGYRTSDMYLYEDMKSCAPVIVSTDDGSFGTKGTVLDAIAKEKPAVDLIYACGPKPMLRGLKTYAEEKGIELYISMEEKMACGIGACLGCVCETTETDEHSHVRNKRICKDGPVFNSRDIVL